MATRIRTTFAGVTFSGFAHGENHISVPTPAFRKILATGNVTAHLRYDIEHDGNGEHDLFNKDAQVDAIRQEFDRWHGDRPWLLYLEPNKSILHYCPHSNRSYELVEKVEA